jgi:hypothetical protein
MLRGELRLHHRRRPPRLGDAVGHLKGREPFAALPLAKPCRARPAQRLQPGWRRDSRRGPPTLRAFRGPYRLPRCLDPNGERSRPSLPPGASISCAFHRHFPSMLRPPEPLSCMTACALSGASARAPWGPEPRPSPRASRAGRSKARAPGLAAPSRQRKIEAVCFGPAQESGTGRCAGPFELLASSGR